MSDAADYVELMKRLDREYRFQQDRKFIRDVARRERLAGHLFVMNLSARVHHELGLQTPFEKAIDEACRVIVHITPQIGDFARQVTRAIQFMEEVAIEAETPIFYNLLQQSPR